MGILSGKLGALSTAATGISSVSNWSIGIDATLPQIANSATYGGTVTLAGQQLARGQYTCDGAFASAYPGQYATFKGTLDGSLGVAAASIVISGINFNCDISGSGAFHNTTSFMVNGAVTYGAAVVTDASSPCPFATPAKGAQLLLAPITDGIGAFYTVLDVMSINWSLALPTHPIATSSTAGWHQVTFGPLSASLTYTCAIEDFSQIATAGSSLPVINSLYDCHITVPGFFTPWIINHLRCRSVDNVNVDIRSGSPVVCSVTLDWTAYETIDSTCTAGLISDCNDGAVANIWGTT